jgi:hypothetical protein
MRITNSLIYFIALFISSQAFSAKVIQAKNGKIMIDLEGETAAVNQNIILLNDQNKKVAIAQINQVKNGKAIATVTKGQAQGNEKVSFGSAKSKTSSNTSNTQQSKSSNETNQVYRTGSKKMSVVVSLMSNTMTTKQSDGVQPTPSTEDVGMKGSTVGVTGVLDWPVIPSISLRGTLGYEPFKTAGTATIQACDNAQSKDCTAEISYLSAGGYLRYDLTNSQTQFWGAAGGSLKFPLGKTTTALKSDDIKMTMTYALALGLDFFLNNKTFIPFSIEQQLFLKSDTVTAGITFLRVGYGLAF